MCVLFLRAPVCRGGDAVVGRQLQAVNHAQDLVRSTRANEKTGREEKRPRNEENQRDGGWAHGIFSERRLRNESEVIGACAYFSCERQFAGVATL